MQCPEIIFAWVWTACWAVEPHPKLNAAASYSSIPSNTDKLLQKNKTQILIGSRVLISWGPGEETLEKWRGSSVTGWKCPGQVILTADTGATTFLKNAVRMAVACPVMSIHSPRCLNCSLPFPNEAPPVWVAVGVLWCSRRCAHLGWVHLGCAHPRCAHLGWWPCYSQRHTSPEPLTTGGAVGSSLGMKHDALVLRCQIFPISSNVVPPVAMGTRGSSAHTWSCLQVAVGYQGRSVMHQAAEGFSFPIKMLALSWIQEFLESTPRLACKFLPQSLYILWL